MTVLAVESLSVHYGVIQALKEVSFAVEEGEIFTLLGANGAGKTTTLRPYPAYFLRQKEGVVPGRDITTIPPMPFLLWD